MRTDAQSQPLTTEVRTRQVDDVSVTVLSTSKADVGNGEWGFSALVEAGDERILFDGGNGATTVLDNAAAAGIDLSTVTSVVISHHHDDHVGGLLALREATKSTNPEAFRTLHVARGMFEPRRFGKKRYEVNDMIRERAAFETSGGRVVIHDRAEPIAPGVWVTGPVPRLSQERNYSGARKVLRDGEWVADPLPESQALVIRHGNGLLVLTGCGHAGIVNIVDHARSTIAEAPVQVLGGFHLHRASPEHVEWTTEQLRASAVTEFWGAHCTGTRAIERARAIFGPERAGEVGVGWRWVAPSDG